MNDLISRQAAIDAMAELQGRASSKGELTGISKAWKKIKQLPSAQPEKRTEERTETHACGLIDRQAAIELVKDVCDAIMSGCESRYDPETEDEVYTDIREVDAILKCNKEVRIALRNMPSAQPERRWIPVTERLPDEARHYLCSFEKSHRIDRDNVDLAYWTGGQWYGYMADAIIAWMPLPEPYKEEEE